MKLATARTDKVDAVLTMLARAAGPWHAAAMAQPRNPRSLGILFTILPLGGAIGLGLWGEPVIGLLAGLGTATLLTVLFWLYDRRR